MPKRIRHRRIGIGKASAMFPRLNKVEKQTLNNPNKD